MSSTSATDALPTRRVDVDPAEPHCRLHGARRRP